MGVTERPDPGRDGAAPQVTVVVPVVDDPDRLATCLDALGAQSGISLEAVVVDNGSRRPPRALVARFPFARLIAEPTVGSYKARNRGAAEATGQFIAFTDADCLPRADWLEAALRHFENDPAVAAVGGRVELLRSAHPSAAEAYERVYAFRQERYVREYGFAATANLVVRRQVFLDVGEFDSSLRSGGDFEWGRRLVRTGHRLVYADDAVVQHPARARLSELVQKRRRLVGGWVMRPASADMEVPGLDGWHETQPRGWKMLQALAFHPHRLGLSGMEGTKVIGVLGLLSLVGVIERARLRVGQPPVR